MKVYSNKISLVRNGRGCYSLDTVIGCVGAGSGNGCYNDCYAAKCANRYGYDFTKHQCRYFEDMKHLNDTLCKIDKIKMPFIRIGTMGDPSSDWNHTIEILRLLKRCGKKIVLITKHWETIKHTLLKYLDGVCVNTSVSALDDPVSLKTKMSQYEKLKDYCHSVLRVVSCKFNTGNKIGSKLDHRQKCLFQNDNVLDTVFRPSKNNKYITEDIINTEKGLFMSSQNLISKYRKNTYLGYCYKCPDMCGINVNKPIQLSFL